MHNRRVTEHHTTAFVNAAVFDGHRYVGRSDAAIVVRDGRIASIGEAPKGAEVVDIDGGLLAPGFVDAHVHTVQGGLDLNRCNLTEGRTRGDYLATIAAYAETHPDVPWILGGGWGMAAFAGGTPTADDLDTVVPDRPVFLPNRDHHGAWANSRALEIAGITRDSPEPPHGRYERDAGGVPTGTLHEGAMDVMSRHLPGITDEQYYAGLLAGQAYLHSMGVTGWQDAIVGEYGGMDDPGPTYVEAAQRGDLTGHVVAALWWDREAGEEQVESLIERRRVFTHGRFRATSVKIMQDGVTENFTAALTTPYLDRAGHPTDNSGHSFVDPVELRQHVARLDDEGFQVHVHGIGDRAVREALDAFEGAASSSAADGGAATTSRTSRWSIPTTCRGSASSGCPRTCSRSGRASTIRWSTSTCPSSVRSGPRGSTRSAPSIARGRAWCRAATGRCPRPTRWRPSTSR